MSSFFDHDPWCANLGLSSLLERLFLISLNQNDTIFEMEELSDEVCSWNFRWRRQFFDWEEILFNDKLT